MDDDRWLSVTEISAHLGIKEQTLYKWIRRKPGMPYHRVGRLLKFKISEIDAWVRAGGAAPKNAKRKEADS